MRAIRPLFRRRSLTQLNFKDNQGKDHYSEFVVRTAPMNTFTGDLDGLYEPTRVLEPITAVAGPNFIDIRPPGDQVWLLDRLSVLHNSAQKRRMDMLLVGAGFSMTLFTSTHMIIANASVDQTVLPTWHEVSGGLEQDHRILIEPLQLRNAHFFRMTGTAFAVGDIITFKYTYRRVR